MLNKNDPLIGAVQEIMKRNEAERNAARLVNEKFGVTDRKALPHEQLGAWDAAYKTVLTEGVEALDEKIKMTKDDIAAMRHPKKDITADDLAALRAGKHKQKAAAGELEEAQKMNIDAAVAARKTAKMADMAKTPEEREELLAKMRKYKSQVRMQKEDLTSPSGMGIKGPDYATGTPDYAVRNTVGPKSNLIKKPTISSGNSTVTQTGKTSSSATKSTMKEENLEEKITAKTDIGSAIKEFRKSDSPQLAGRSSEGRRQAAIAAVLQARRKAKKMNEGFNNRHNSSVNASAGKQVVAEIAAYPGTPAGTAASSTSNSMMATQARLRAGEAAQARLAAARSRATSATDTAPQPQSGATSLARQQSGDTAPRPQPNMALQRRQSGDTAPRPQSSVALQRRQSGDTAPKPQPNMALQRQQSGDIAPRPQNSAALQRQQAGQQARMGGNPTGAPNSSALPKKVVPTGNPNKAGSGGNVGGAPKPKLRPVKATATAAGARRQQPVAGSQRRAQTSARPSALQRQRIKSKNYRDSAVTGPGGKRG